MTENDVTVLPQMYIDEISSSEKLKVEFKESYGESEEIRETMVAFANGVGGRIYVGVKEVQT